ncbi:MAG: flagellin, partial [Nitrospinota bacterium]|nr:flagellin [Nitrospinota bacterium]
VKQAIDDVRSNKLGRLAVGLATSAKSLADVNVTTTDGANDALKLVDDAINSITTLRGNLGAFQANVLESNINSLGVAKENLASAVSAIRDADFAEETVQFTRNQILLQAGTAILTQANAIPQAVLQLLA